MGSGGLTRSVTWKIAQPTTKAMIDAAMHADARLILPGRFADRDVDDEK